MTSNTKLTLVYPWGNMRDYILELSSMLSCKHTIYRPRQSFLSYLLVREKPDATTVKASIQYPLERKQIKLTARGALPGPIKLRIQQVKYVYKFLAIYAHAYRHLKTSPTQLVVVWNGLRLNERAVVTAAEALGKKVAYLENGLTPKTTLIDPQGVNVDCSLPREASFYRHYAESKGGYDTLEELCSDLEVRQFDKNSRDYSEDGAFQQDLKKGFIFVPFQVEADSQVLVNSPRIRSMKALYEEIEPIAHKHPEWTFVIKEHPSCDIRYTDLHNRCKNIIFSLKNTQQLISDASCIVTLNSSVGLESLLQYKHVIILGDACYDIEGISRRAKNRDDIEKSIRECHEKNWKVDRPLIKAFINYLKLEFLIPGS